MTPFYIYGKILDMSIIEDRKVAAKRYDLKIDTCGTCTINNENIQTTICYCFFYDHFNNIRDYEITKNDYVFCCVTSCVNNMCNQLTNIPTEIYKLASVRKSKKFINAMKYLDIYRKIRKKRLVENIFHPDNIDFECVLHTDKICFKK